jgi:hypothetical protein
MESQLLRHLISLPFPLPLALARFAPLLHIKNAAPPQEFRERYSSAPARSKSTAGATAKYPAYGPSFGGTDRWISGWP